MLEMKNITKIYNPGTVQETCLFRDFSLTINKGSFVSVVGSNGSGKTSMLNLLCGSIPVDAGQILMDGQDITRVKEFRRYRRMGRVYQNPAMGTCGTMTILQNLSMADNKGKPFGLTPGTNRKKLEAYRAMLAPLGLGLEDKMDVPVGSLSGGQRQRVALGRAIVKDQKLFLMDEPLSNLDAKLRVSMRSEISKLHRQLGSTTIYVTHDQVEAMTMADRIVIMKDGVIQQVGKPMDLYEHPANKFVAGFIGSPQMNFYEVKVAGNTMTFSDGSKMQLPESVVTSLNGRQGTLVLGIRGEDIKLDPQNLDLYKDNIMSATVDSVEVMGNENNLYFNFGGTASVARVSKYEISKPGDTIDFAFVPSRMHFFDTQTEESLF